MTNQERSELLTLCHPVCAADIMNIKRALDEAEKRGYEKCRDEAKENGVALIREARIIGQKDMRERAAKIFIDPMMPLCETYARLIRALPIEGE